VQVQQVGPGIAERLRQVGAMVDLAKTRRPAEPHDFDRPIKLGIKIAGLGTLWSLYREQNVMHRKVIKGAGKSAEPYKQLPKPFATVIPNASAIAMASEPNQKPKSFAAKYSTPFARLYHELCEEIVQRCQWPEASISESRVTAST